MGKGKITKICTILIASLCLSACGGESVKKNTESSAEYLRELENGKYYIRHKDLSCEEVYFDQATFNMGNKPMSPDSTRVMWNKDLDDIKIPTLYEGESLILYSTDVINETFVLERFEDYGYTIGFCGIKATDSGRFSISTKAEDKCTYPYGDTDVILNYENEVVILDKLGGTEMRVFEDEETGEDVSASLTRSGTIYNLNKDGEYDAELYEGTELHKDLAFVADIHAFGSMEVTETTDYSFEQASNVINIAIPEFFNTGYYSVNGMGLFRYIKGESYNETTQFNVPNNPPENDKKTRTQTLPEVVNYGTANNRPISNDVYTSQFLVTQAGELTVRAKFSVSNAYGSEGDGLPDVSAILTTPTGQEFEMQQDEEGLYLHFTAVEGTYTIEYYDLNARSPELIIE